MLAPMLAVNWPISQLHKFPLKEGVYASKKLDGIRAILHEGKFYSRSGKLIPNLHAQHLASTVRYDYPLDGELIVGATTAPDCFRKTTSSIMSMNSCAIFTFYIFDAMIPKPFVERQAWLAEQNLPLWAQLLQHEFIERQVGALRLLDSLDFAIRLGYEGLILRTPHGQYKHGRATKTHPDMAKLKPFADAEATILACLPLERNYNEAYRDELGQQKRSSHAANKFPEQMLGSFRCESRLWPEHFNVGTGFTEEERYLFWQNKPIGKTIKFKYLPSGGKDRPRHPVFLGIRKD